MDVHWIRSNGTMLAFLMTAAMAVGVLTALVLTQQRHDETADYGRTSLVTGPGAGVPSKASIPIPVPANVPAPPAVSPVVPAPQVTPAPKVTPKVTRAPQKPLPSARSQPRALPVSPPPLASSHAVTLAPETAPADSATHLSTKGGPPELDQTATESGTTGSTTTGTSGTIPAVKAHSPASASRPAGVPSSDAAGSNHDHLGVVNEPSNGDQLHQTRSTTHRSSGTSGQRSAVERELHSDAQRELPPGTALDSPSTG
jgi:hypothetical protein